VREILPKILKLKELELAWASDKIDNDVLDEIREINPKLTVRRANIPAKRK
jgi:hypothetical protein